MISVLNEQLALCAELYNAAVQERREAWQLERKSISWFDQNRQLAHVRRDRKDVATIHFHALENVLRRVDLAFDAFFRRVKDGLRPGYPRYRSSRRYDSITFREVGKPIRGNKVRLPKIGNVRIKVHRPLDGVIKTLTVKREADRWFALFCVEVEAAPLPFNRNTIGIDVGLSSFATLSDGTVIQNPKWFRAAQARLRRLQRRVARRKKGSTRKLKAALWLQKAHGHVQAQRLDFHHKESRKIVNHNGLIAVEDLNVQGMVRNHNLAKSIADAGWSTFINILTYKAEEAGRLLVKVDPRGTSQTCLCGAEVRKGLADREHVCTECGLIADRDLVSAQLILARSAPSGANVDAVMSCVA